MTEIPRPALPRRLAAILYDSLLVAPLIMAAVALATGLRVLVTGDTGGGSYGATLNPWVVRLIALACLAGFYCYFWRRGGQSLGMRAWRIRLQGRDGGPVHLGQCLLRCAAAVLSLLPAGLGYWWCLLDPGRRCWHDHLSGTELELLPKNKT